MVKKFKCNNCKKKLKEDKVCYWKTKIVCHNCFVRLSYNQRLKSNVDKLKQLRQLNGKFKKK